jgi:hypothetical protein
MKIVKHPNVQEYGIMEEAELRKFTNFIYDNLSKNDKEFDGNLNKKLIYLSKSLLECIFDTKRLSREEIIINAYTSLLKKGAHYLRLDSLQVIKEMIESSCLKLMNLEEIESNNLFNIVYIETFVREKYN